MLDESSFLNPSKEHTKYGCRKEMVLNREKDCQSFDNMCNRFKNYINKCGDKNASKRN